TVSDDNRHVGTTANSDETDLIPGDNGADKSIEWTPGDRGKAVGFRVTDDDIVLVVIVRQIDRLPLCRELDITDSRVLQSLLSVGHDPVGVGCRLTRGSPVFAIGTPGNFADAS